MMRQSDDTRPFALVGMTQAERKVLLDLVRQEAPDLLHPGAVKRIRSGTWALIMKKFNESCSCYRTVAQLKSCLQNIMRKTLQKKAGGGTAQQSFRKINFTLFEKNLILNLGKQRPVVFSKLKDGQTQAVKRKAWTEMMWTFNRTQGIKTQRTAREIKNCLVNMTNRNKEVDEFLKSQMPEYARQNDIPEQPHLDGTVVLGGVSHPVTNVHGTPVTQNPMQSPTSSVQRRGTMANNKKSQPAQSNKPQVPKHRFLLPKPLSAPASSFPNRSTPVLIGAVSQNVPTPQTSIPQNNHPTLTHPVRTISVPQVSMSSSQLSPPVSTLRTQPTQSALPHVMQAGPAQQVQSSPAQPIVHVQTFSSSQIQPLQPMSVQQTQSHCLPPAQDSDLGLSGWIPETQSQHHQNPSSSKPAVDETLAETRDDCIIEIKEESGSDPEELYGLEQQLSATPMEIHKSPTDTSQLPRYGDQLMNSGVNRNQLQVPPAKSTTPQQPEELSSEQDGMGNVQIKVHRDRGESQVGQNQAFPSSSFTSSLPTEENHHHSSGYLIQTSSQFASQSQLLSQDSSCSTNGLTTDLSTEIQDSGIHRSEPGKDADGSRRARLKRRKESVGTLKKRLLQREHDLRIQMSREEHAWLLEEHMWKREEHELRMNMIRINSKFS
ncbi:uncharacterized protein LOC100891767 [Strongylocentrotus purpuratus]|uniref:Myb/SANT-like DNA-binding domain-containing protein n=1 Tax=Strongylocentrotus purpuratus TaxID=7668 RepID=A0A7M7GQ41_STRPU|nr:uncharacterized protein LOC100891767 [Strongylocentrotus purpuratus]